MNLMHAAHVPAGDGPFPTILALHGWGASAHDLLGLAPYLHGGEALVLCPQGPVAVPIGPGINGWGWFPLTGGGPLGATRAGALTAGTGGFAGLAALGPARRLLGRVLPT